ncbi:Hypothetical Protein OBI_RACECAR_206 [Arthrobacter phage Racecar]|nr:hypothetical protein PBI_RACECAR_288 [Arthrobacter phage Racecar]
MTTTQKWFVLVVLAVAGLGYLIGMSQHDMDVQKNKFQMECVQSGGTVSTIGITTNLICNKN